MGTLGQKYFGGGGKRTFGGQKYTKHNKINTNSPIQKTSGDKIALLQA